jgi:hypothetical protein
MRLWTLSNVTDVRVPAYCRKLLEGILYTSSVCSDFRVATLPSRDALSLAPLLAKTDDSITGPFGVVALIPDDEPWRQESCLI